MGFVASCIESAAERLGCQYDEMLERMERVGLIPEEGALNRLRYLKPNNQICMLNQDMTDRFLTFTEAVKLSD